jgi:tRNA uridine 5-carbamoylmethylation protein Kti12
VLQLITDERLAKIRDGNLSLEAQKTRKKFQLIHVQVEKETRNARNGKSHGQNWFNFENNRILDDKYEINYKPTQDWDCVYP